jgi:hypothetical protein
MIGLFVVLAFAGVGIGGMLLLLAPRTAARTEAVLSHVGHYGGGAIVGLLALYLLMLVFGGAHG